MNHTLCKFAMPILKNDSINERIKVLENIRFACSKCLKVPPDVWSRFTLKFSSDDFMIIGLNECSGIVCSDCAEDFVSNLPKGNKRFLEPLRPIGLE